MKIPQIKDYKIILIIFTLLTFTQLVQAQFCENSSEISGKYEQREFHALLKETSNYLKAYKTGIFNYLTNLTNKKNQIELKNQYEKDFSLKDRKELLSNIENICITSIKIYDGSIYAVVNGTIDYKSKKKNEGIFFYIDREDNEFSFTKLMFSNFDIYEIIIQEKIESHPTKITEKLNSN